MEQNTPVERSSTTPEVSSETLDTMSLAEYRAQRETKSAATPNPSTTVQAPAGDSAGENSSQQGGEDDSSDHDGDAVGGDDKPARKGGFQRKIERQAKEIEELRRQLAGKTAASAADNSKSAEPATKTEQPKPELPQYEKPKPKLEDFDSMEQFAEALTDWKLDAKDFERIQLSKAEEQRKQAQTVIEGWNSRVKDVKQERPDYDDVLKSVEDIQIPPAHQRLFLDSEIGPKIAYDLASDPDELKKFAAMDPLTAARFFGKLETAYQSQEDPKTPEPRVSSAPRPVRPVGVRSVGTPDVKAMNLQDWRAARESGRIR